MLRSLLAGWGLGVLVALFASHAGAADSQGPLAPWAAFSAAHGPWHIEWNEGTGSPRRALGTGIRVLPRVESAAQAREAALGFLRREAALTKAGAEIHLESVSAFAVGRVWYVHFRQLHQSMPLLFSDISVRLDKNGKLFAFASEIQSSIELSTDPQVDALQARRLVQAAVAFDPSVDHVSGGEELAILPLEDSSHALVRQVELMQSRPAHDWLFLIDAHDGRIHARVDRLRHATVAGELRASLPASIESDERLDFRVPNAELRLGGMAFHSEADGVFRRVGPTGARELLARLRGRYAEVIRADGEPAALLRVGIDHDPPALLSLRFDDRNSHVAERSAFVQLNRARAWHAGLDPGFTALDIPLRCYVNIADACNAYWRFGDRSLHFFAASEECANTALIPDIVHHEYGHVANDLVYVQAGRPQGMLNGALHEALADITAALMEDDPILGQGMYHDGRVIRRLDDGHRYPADLVGEPHLDGQILAGALWSLRERIGVRETARLLHAARHGLPDDLNDAGAAFGEFFVELLVADDDDGNLGNGSPHGLDIRRAFDRAGLGPSMFIEIHHEELPDLAQAKTAQGVEAWVRSSSGLFPLAEESVRLVYQVDAEPPRSVAMIAQPDGRHRAQFPAQRNGSLVRYHLEASARGGSARTLPAEPADHRFSFLVGPQLPVLVDDFEADAGWQVENDGGPAFTGGWERADPQGSAIVSASLQPEDDHSPEGTHCFVTGARAGTGPGNFDVDDGTTILTSPRFDLSQALRPAIRYYRWYTNDLGANPGADEWRVQLSNDDGNSWVDVERSSESQARWVKRLVSVEDIVAPTDRMRLRFMASDLGEGSLVEAALDDVDIVSFRSGVDPQDARAPLPVHSRLHQNVPNPFNPSTRIDLEIAVAGPVELIVYDLAGRRVRSLYAGSLPAGTHSFRWDGRDEAGARVASGAYFYRLQSAAARSTRRMTLLK